MSNSYWPKLIVEDSLKEHYVLVWWQWKMSSEITKRENNSVTIPIHALLNIIQKTGRKYIWMAMKNVGSFIEIIVKHDEICTNIK